MLLDVDDVLEQIGSLGYYQIIHVSILVILMFLSSPMMTLIVTFTAAEPPWKCVNGSQICTIEGLFKLGDQGYKTRCDMPRSEWEFTKDFTSIVTEWDLVCDRSLYASFATSMVFAGWFVGVMVFGVASDKFGRKPVTFISCTISCAGCLISAFVPALWLYVVCRFITGFGLGGSFLTMFILATEFAGIRHRGHLSIIYGSFWHIGSHVLSLFAWLLPDWKHLTIALSVPGVFSILLWRILEESPRWLLLEGRTEEAKDILRRVAKVNKKEMPSGTLGLKVPKGEDAKSGNLFDLFRSWQSIKITLIMFLCWFSVALQTYGTTFFSVSLPGNMYVNFLLASLPGLPGCLYCLWAANRFGRKKATCFSFLVPSILCGIMAALPKETPNEVGMTIFLLVKFFSFADFGLVYLFSSEVFPTMIRNVGMGSCSAVARIGGFVAPYIVWLERVNVALPMGIMGVCTLAASILIMTISETNMAPTPETTHQFGKGSDVENDGKIKRWSLELNDKPKYVYKETVV